MTLACMSLQKCISFENNQGLFIAIIGFCFAKQAIPSSEKTVFFVDYWVSFVPNNQKKLKNAIFVEYGDPYMPNSDRNAMISFVKYWDPYMPNSEKKRYFFWHIRLSFFGGSMLKPDIVDMNDSHDLYYGSRRKQSI